MIDSRTKLIPPATHTILKDKQHSSITYERIKTDTHPNKTVNTISQKVIAKNKMERKVNGIEIDFIIGQRGQSPETKRLQEERLTILQPGRKRVVGKSTREYKATGLDSVGGKP